MIKSDGNVDVGILFVRNTFRFDVRSKKRRFLSLHGYRAYAYLNLLGCGGRLKDLADRLPGIQA